MAGRVPIRFRISAALSAERADVMMKCFRATFGVNITTAYNVIMGRMVTERVDGADFTPEQATWLTAFDLGWDRCSAIAYRAAS